MKTVTCIAPINISTLKYWGNRNEELVLPLNDSIGTSLSTEHIYSKTTVMASPLFEENKFWTNGKEIQFNETFKKCLNEIIRRSNKKKLLKCKLHICSENNFPISTDVEYASLITALAVLYRVEGDISSLVRRSSKGACRAIHGGWVRWNKGLLPKGEDSIPTQIAPHSHWPQMRVIVLVIDQNSTRVEAKGVETDFLKHRVGKIVPRRAQQMVDAVLNRDFESFALLTMQESNQFHAVCLDTYPPCFFMNDVSRAVVEMVHSYNEYRSSIKVAYTFEDGPNAYLYLLKDDVVEVLSLITEIFPPPTTGFGEYFKGYSITVKSKKLNDILKLEKQNCGSIKCIIYTKIGDGPKILTDDCEHLLTKDGVPKWYFQEKNYVRKVYKS